MIKLIVGLGNPGNGYELNRHNVGFWLVDFLAQSFGGTWKNEAKFFGMVCKITIESQEIILLKPTTFMNNSGKSVASLTNFFKINPEQIIVAHDELDIPITSIKFKKSGGHGGHNGLRDIINQIGKDFYRVRIGIDRPTNGQVADFVLKNPSKKEQEIIIENINSFLHLTPDFIQGDFDNATQKLHTNTN
jgi:PTH1 family peptidyl-tRNA hydrolase